MEQSEKSASQDHAQSTVGLTTPSAKAVGHTPLPWTSQQFTSGEIQVCDYAGYRKVAVMTWVGKNDTATEDEANAAFIVRAANSHYQLLSALKDAVAVMGEAGSDEHIKQLTNEELGKLWTSTRREAEQAISAAEEGL